MKNSLIYLTLIGLFSASVIYSQQDGTPDTDFGNNGIVLEAYSSGVSTALTHSILLPGGKILACGKATLTSSEIVGCLARFLPNGDMDDTFGTNGWKIYNLPYNLSFFNSLSMQTDGKYIATGFADNGSTNGFLVCRILADGSLDNSFGTNGAVFIDLGDSAGAQSVALQADGKIVLAGYNFSGSNGDAVICRLNVNGSLDNTFANNGIATIDLHINSLDTVRGLAIHNGKIIFSGMALNGNGSDYDALALVRLKSNGDLDPSFGVGGISILDDINQEDTLIGPSTNLIIAPDDAIFVTSHYTGINGNDVILFKFLPNGYPDNSFGEYGMTLYDMTEENYANDLALQSDGKIIVTGSHFSTTGSEFLIMRFLEDGDLDSSFGDYSGVALFDLSGGYDVAMSVNIQDDSKILVSGYSNSDNIYFAHMRLFSGLEISVDTENTASDNTLLYPNPVNTKECRINYNLEKTSKLNISILNSKGEIITNLLNVQRDQGEHSELLQLPENLPSGVYLITATAGNQLLFRKKIIVSFQ